MDPLTLYLCAGFGLALCFSVFASYGNFCTMGALSDWVNMGELSRLRSWALAVGVAIFGVALADAQGVLDIALTASAETSVVPYLAPELRWFRHVLGGLVFGVGMTLAGGCGSKNLMRVGAGDLKALLALSMLAVAAWSMVYTETGGALLLWFGAAYWDLTALGAETQAVGSVLAALFGQEGAGLQFTVACGLGACLLLFAFSGAAFRAQRSFWLAGLGIGLVLLLCWVLSTGEMGAAATEESAFSEQPTLSMGAQNLSFTLPVAQAGYYLFQALPVAWLTLGVVMVFGMVVGGFLHAVISRSFRLQWFSRASDFFSHVAGGLLMGFGGVVAMGCTVGQGLGGVSTLALGSFLTVGAIVLGCVLTLRVRLYALVYEDASWAAVLLTALAESRVIPQMFRRLEKI